ncbi:phage holin family protein [Gemmata sp.]|uniref:phage holin family protein n=1 Tax=Gemmata sp. TaxID=1914242 RepID=UPI003F7049B3
MAHPKRAAEEPDLRTLLGEIVQDSKHLVAQQVALIKAEAGQELTRAGVGVAKCAGGAGAAAAGGLLTGFALAHLLRDATGLPMWACYVLAAGGVGAAGAALVRSGRADLAELGALPQTTKALGENLEWLRDRLIPAAG